jgi:hypothetical protein
MSNRLIALRPTWRGAPMIYTVRKLGLTGNLRVCLDAGDDASYASGQSWLDTSGNGYDFFRGADGSATGTDPTFNGTAGRRTASEYFSFDGGDYFTYDTTIEAWMQTLHKDNAVFTAAGWLLLTTGSVQTILGTLGGGVAGSSHGINFQTTAGNALQLFVGNASTGTTITSTATFAAAWSFIAIALDESVGAGGGTFQINGTQEAFNSAYSSPSSSNASGNMQLGARGSAVGPIANTGRMATMNVWDRRLSTAELLTLFMATRGRFGV